MSLLDAALAAASRGFRVHPLHAGQKVPVLDDWPLLASGDEATIRRWWRQNPSYNVGLAMGWMTDGRFAAAVDYDCKAGKAGMQSLEQMATLDITPRTLRTTTPSGGAHLFYEVPSDAGLTVSVNRLPGFPDVDLRCAGGNIVAPGSVIDGVSYSWADDVPIAAAPADLVALLRSSHGNKREFTSREPLVDYDGDEGVDRATWFLKHEAGEALQGAGGDAATYRVIASVRDFGISEALASQLVDEHWNQDSVRVQPAWDLAELQRKIENVYAYAQNPAGVRLASAEFEAVPPSSSIFRGNLTDFGIAREFTPAEELIRDMIPAVGVGFLGGQSGALKTFVAIHFCACVATGAPFAGRRIEKQGAVLYVAFEGRGTIAGRVKARRSLLENPDTDLAMLMLADFGPLASADDQKAFRQVLGQASDYARDKWGMPLRSIVIDTVIASGMIAEDKENDPAAWQKVFDFFQGVAERLQLSVILVHHYGKTAAAGLRGSSNARAGADFVLAATCDRNELTGETSNHFLALAKSRTAPEGPIGAIRKTEVEIGSRPDGSVVKSLVLEFDTGQRPAAGAKRRLNKAESAFVVAAARAIEQAGEKIVVDGAKILAVRKADVRRLFGESYGSGDGDTEKNAETIRKQFANAWKALPAGWSEIEHDGDAWIREISFDPSDFEKVEQIDDL